MWLTLVIQLLDRVLPGQLVFEKTVNIQPGQTNISMEMQAQAHV